MKRYRLILPVAVLALLSAFAPLRAQSQPADPEQRTTYEYKQLWFPAQPGVAGLMDEMNDLGAEGWELVTVIQTSDIQCWAFFKRSVPPVVNLRQRALPPPPPGMCGADENSSSGS
ncbi:MAG: hypothetical protein Q7Q73_04480 [Verrucomicrobiota bacterium JB024]|nr:hypothetical protein [Verrucomicrobiota bacterium JB024]